MAEEKKDVGTRHTFDGHQPLKKGYQPAPDDLGYQATTSNIDTTKPPQGGSGVPSDSADSGENE
jgi:hypothetical protein